MFADPTLAHRKRQYRHRRLQNPRAKAAFLPVRSLKILDNSRRLPLQQIFFELKKRTRPQRAHRRDRRVVGRRRRCAASACSSAIGHALISEGAWTCEPIIDAEQSLAALLAASSPSSSSSPSPIAVDRSHTLDLLLSASAAVLSDSQTTSAERSPSSGVFTATDSENNNTISARAVTQPPSCRSSGRFSIADDDAMLPSLGSPRALHLSWSSSFLTRSLHLLRPFRATRIPQPLSASEMADRRSSAASCCGVWRLSSSMYAYRQHNAGEDGSTASLPPAARSCYLDGSCEALAEADDETTTALLSTSSTLRSLSRYTADAAIDAQAARHAPPLAAPRAISSMLSTARTTSRFWIEQLTAADDQQTQLATRRHR